MRFNKVFLLVSFALVSGFALFYFGCSDGKTGESQEQSEATSDNAKSEDSSASESKGSKANQAMASLEKKFGGKETPIPVSAEPTIKGDLIQRVIAQGQVFSYQKADLVSEVTGKLVKLHVIDGQMVKKGDLLAEIDDRSFELAFKESQARYLSAVADYLVYEENVSASSKLVENVDEQREELKKQLEVGDISEENFRQKNFLLDLESIKSGTRRSEVIAARTLDQARVQRDKAKLDWEKCQIIAPFDGQIFDVQVTNGQLIYANTKLFHLINIYDLVVKARVLESEIGQIREGREAAIEFPALRDLGRIKGKVKAVSPYVNADDKTIETVLAIESNNPRIRPGMFAEVYLDAAVYTDQLMVPKTAILPRDDRKVIFVVGEDNRASWIYVKTGPENEDYVAITEGKLNEGDMVLTDNHFTMGHGTLVKVSKK